MNRDATPIKRALISLSDKEGIVELATTLAKAGVEIISTGNTAKLLIEAGIEVQEVATYTGFPEIFGGRVKTLHPKIAGGILTRRDCDGEEAIKHNIPTIDLVVCNLYPFRETIEHRGTSLEEALEKIDIGGVTLIRAAAKNFGWVTVLTDKGDYQQIGELLAKGGGIPYEIRKALAAKAFAYSASYDALVAHYLNREPFPESLTLTFTKENLPLRYGENPHQMGAVYRGITSCDPFSLLECHPLQGKQLSYNNLYDTYGAVETLREFNECACVIVKHATPCGVALGATPLEALKRAFLADELSAFGGIIALNREVDGAIAHFLEPLFIEILIAPSYTEEALTLLKKRRNLRVLESGALPPLTPIVGGRLIGKDLLVQERDAKMIKEDELTLVTKVEVSKQQLSDLLFAWKVVKHVKSNAIVSAKGGVTCGIGGGQVSRIDALKIALAKSGTTEGLVIASDAFFPFRDSIDYMATRGVVAIIQPGGSIRDEEVIAACNEAGIAMLFTGYRAFLHG